MVEYFVPRSVSEFNLAGVVAGSVPPPPPPQVPRPSSAASVLRTPGSSTKSEGSRGREKMVTFEDDPVVASPGVRKALALEDVFM